MGEKYVIPEVTSNREWLFLTGRRSFLTQEDEDKIKATSSHLQPIKPHQMMLIDVYTGWSGPCLAVESHLRRIRHSFVEAPDCLALARACCDEIEDLEAFKHDIRPTFLFWARGGPVALLRGANRPLLTRLIQQEVGVESKQSFRPSVEIDFTSPKVIQCAGDLAKLENDDVIRSIGCGNTDKLSTFYYETESTKSAEKHASSSPENIENTQNNAEGITEGSEEPGNTVLTAENDASKSGPSQSNFDGDLDKIGQDGEDFPEDYFDEDEDEIMERITVLEREVDGATGSSIPEIEVEESAFGRKIRKRKKKMETRLLKEILNDVKLTSKRH